MFLGKGALKISSKFTGQHPWQNVISIKLLYNFIEVALQHGCYPANLLLIFIWSLLEGCFCNFLFGSVKLTKNADPEKYKYSDYSIGFDSRSEFLFTDGSMGRNVIIFGADKSSSVHADNKNKAALIFC